VVSDRDQELAALTALCRELATHGLNVGMSDARPAVWVRAGRSGPRLWITVDAAGEVFESAEVEGRFPIGDSGGAATAIAEQALGADAGEVS
jgi:hypothetical protein